MAGNHGKVRASDLQSQAIEFCQQSANIEEDCDFRDHSSDLSLMNSEQMTSSPSPRLQADRSCEIITCGYTLQNLW